MARVVLSHSAQGLRAGVRAFAPLAELGVDAWPTSVPVQAHWAIGDAWVDAGEVESSTQSARAAGAAIEVHAYRGTGHLVAGPDSPDYDQASTPPMPERSLAFLARL